MFIIFSPYQCLLLVMLLLCLLMFILSCIIYYTVVILGSDDQSEMSEFSVSTSGCSSIMPNPDRRDYQQEILLMNDSRLQQLGQDKLNSPPHDRKDATSDSSQWSYYDYMMNFFLNVLLNTGYFSLDYCFIKIIDIINYFMFILKNIILMLKVVR